MTSWTPGGVSPGGPLRSYRTGSPVAPDPVEQALEVGQAGERVPKFQPGIGPEDAEQAAGFCERLPAVLETPGLPPMPGRAIG
jgi:hypothetical protein